MNEQTAKYLKDMSATAQKMQQEILSKLNNGISDIDSKVEEEILEIDSNEVLSDEVKKGYKDKVLLKKDQIKSLHKSSLEAMKLGDIEALKNNLSKLTSL